jgi:hypothetical protein
MNLILAGSILLDSTFKCTRDYLKIQGHCGKGKGGFWVNSSRENLYVYVGLAFNFTPSSFHL